MITSLFQQPRDQVAYSSYPKTRPPFFCPSPPRTKNAKKIPFGSPNLTSTAIDKSGRGHHSSVLLPRAFRRASPQDGAGPRPFRSNAAQGYSSSSSSLGSPIRSCVAGGLLISSSPGCTSQDRQTQGQRKGLSLVLQCNGAPQGMLRRRGTGRTEHIHALWCTARSRLVHTQLWVTLSTGSPMTDQIPSRNVLRP